MDKRKSGKHKMVRVVQTGMPMGYPYYPPQQQVVYVERPTKKKKTTKHKRKVKKSQPKDLFDQYESELKGMEAFMPEAPEEERTTKHKRKSREKSHKEEMESLEEWMEFTEAPSKGKHKVRKVEPLWIDPEDIPEEEEGDWFKSQQAQYKKQQEDFIKMAESGKKFAEGSYKTFTEAKRKARMLSRGLKNTYFNIRRKFGLKVPARPPVQVFIEPTAEGDYVVYGQVKKTEVPVMRPTQPIKVFTEPPKGEYVRYEDLM